MKTLITTLLLCVLAVSAQAQQKLVPTRSEIVFVSKQMGVPVEGRFQKFEAQLAFDPKKTQTAKVALQIDLGSVNMGSQDVQAELAKPEWFHSLKLPRASFVSTAFQNTGTGKWNISGKLNIKGQSRDVVVPVALMQVAGQTMATGSLTIQRMDFKIGDGAWSDTSIVANDVLVRFNLAFTGVAPL